MQPFEKADRAHNPQLRDPCPLTKLGSPVSLSEEEERTLAQFVARYPEKRAAILPLLWMVQEKYGWVPEEAFPVAAERCGTSLSHVYGVVSFYTMFNRSPIGRYHLRLCTNLSCQLRGAEHLLQCLRERLQIDLTETTPDRLFTLDEVECLAACEMAPALQVNDALVGPLDEKGLDALLQKLRDGVG